MIKIFESEVNEKNVAYWIEKFKEGRQVELNNLDNYYNGVDNIGKVVQGSNRINNNVHVNLAYMITKNAVDYFIGKPVKYSYEEFGNEEYLKELQFKNLEETENKTIAKDLSKYGRAYELVNIKDDKTLYYKRLDPLTSFDVYQQSIIPERIAHITFITYTGRYKSVITQGFIYTAEEIIEFTYKNRVVTFIDRKANVFGKIPVIYYQNNADNTGDYERVTELLTAYSKLMSCAVDDYESISNAILMIKDTKKIDEETKKSLNATRAIQLFSENAEMAFINKTLDSEFVKTLRKALREDILTVSNVPDFTDEKFSGNSSGVALSYKLIGFENLRADKELYFKQALNRRWEIISLYPAKRFEIKPDNININMYANLPQNIEMILKLAELKNDGGLSLKTMLEKSQLVDDVEEEIERINEEKINIKNEDQSSLDLKV